MSSFTETPTIDATVAVVVQPSPAPAPDVQSLPLASPAPNELPPPAPVAGMSEELRAEFLGKFAFDALPAEFIRKRTAELSGDVEPAAVVTDATANEPGKEQAPTTTLRGRRDSFDLDVRKRKRRSNSTDSGSDSDGDSDDESSTETMYPHERQQLTLGERVADSVSATVGSWRFLGVNSLILGAWIILNATASFAWDPFPFILLNLFLSFQAAYTAPIIVMSQNRASNVDRIREQDLHKKVDHIRLNQIHLLRSQLLHNEGKLHQVMERLGVQFRRRKNSDVAVAKEVERITNGEENFQFETKLTRVPVANKKKLVCFGLINLGRDENNLSFPERVADAMSKAVGSWHFVITQSSVLLFWVVYNLTGPFEYDPYPFILLNLCLSFQAAYTGPVIMMAQNRQSFVDHCKSSDLHEKVDHIRMLQTIDMWALMQRQKRDLDALILHLGATHDRAQPSAPPAPVAPEPEQLHHEPFHPFDVQHVLTTAEQHRAGHPPPAPATASSSGPVHAEIVAAAAKNKRATPAPAAAAVRFHFASDTAHDHSLDL